MDRTPPLPPVAIMLNKKDNVAVVRAPVEVGAALGILGVTVKARVPSGHKIAIRPIAAGEAIVKYGQPIGQATVAIAPGEHVHLHNVTMSESGAVHAFSTDLRQIDPLPERTFLGFPRPTGEVGTRNYIGIVSSVNCSATVAKIVADHFNNKGGLTNHVNVDGVVALTHGGGCAMNTAGEGYRYLVRTLAGYARNPNFGAILMIGLGCETNQIDMLLERSGLSRGPLLRTMTIQQTGGTRKSVEQAIAAIGEMLDTVNGAERVPVPLSGLKLALECGGSDGYSGISANPALGYAADLLVRHGGTAVLAETPEIYGAEHLLTRRARTPEVGQKLLERIAWWRAYTASNGAELNNNPSHGNKAGGLTTILEKSLGAVAKGGTMPLEAVYEYAEHVDRAGFVFMDTPGYDPVAVTGQVAGGCNIICFTTGRGSVSGFKPAPCIKIATNDQMFAHMEEDMDINCGGIVSGAETIEEAGSRIFEKIVAVASGAHSRSEEFDYGENEFVPWPLGAVT